MAKVKMMNVTVFALRRERKPLLEHLQRLGVVDISRSKEEDPENGFVRPDTESAARSFLRSAEAADQAIKVLEPYCKKKKGLLESFSGRRIITDEQYRDITERSADIMSLCHDALNASQEINSNAAEKVRLKARVSSLLPWQKLDVSEQFQGTASTSAFIGSLSTSLDEKQLYETVAAAAPDVDFYVETVSRSENQTCIFLLCPKSDKSEMESALRTLKFQRPPQATSKVPSQKLREVEERLSALDQRDCDLKAGLEKLAGSIEDMQSVADYFTARAEKYRAIGSFDHSKNTFIIKGYIPEESADCLKSDIENNYTAAVVIEEADPDKAPVALKNNKFTAPAASLTELYSMPGKDDIDPTPIMSFFYYLFFGMMLSDAGYGLLLFLGTLFIIKKCHPEKPMEMTMRLFMYCGISTMLWGALFGSFFGDIIWVVSRTYFGKELPKWPFDPMANATALFVLSLALGLVMIMSGLTVKLINTIRHGRVAEAIFETGSWLVILSGLAVLAVGFGLSVPVLKTIGGVTAIFGALMVVGNGVRLKGPAGLITGLGGLYDVTGYMGDLMSFSRLMALGLTTAAMGQVFNLLGSMFGKGVFGVITLIIIFTAGHLLSFALNALGSYVHTLRLQYVELFSKFYEGGGHKFMPFAHNGKYTRFKEDNKQ